MNAFRNGSGPVVWTGIVAVTCLLLLVLQKILWLVVPFLLALIRRCSNSCSAACPGTPRRPG